MEKLSQTFWVDFRAGFISFLIALPLSIGISLASGAPPSAGLLAAIVGGILGSFVGSGQVMINGPAAGLIVVVLDSVRELGFAKTLAAIFFAGVLQMILGLVKAGRWMVCIPTSVIHGMLASIGVTIVAKQIYVLLGTVPHVQGVIPQILALPSALQESNWVIFFVGLCCLAAVVGLTLPRNRWVKMVPAPLIAVVIGVFFDKYFDMEHLHAMTFLNHTFEVGEKFLLHVPTEMRGLLNFPDWSALSEGMFWKMVATIGLVASIESLLSSLAVDRLDPLKRQTQLNRELLGKGLCNSLLGLVGGLPIITEIVRSSANVANGARTYWANVIHGTLIAAFVILAPSLLNTIPLAAFAAILIVVGFKLAHPHQLLHTWEIGWDQLALFVVTLVAVLSTDILIGVGMGILLKLILTTLRSGSIKGMLKAHHVVQTEGSDARIQWSGPATFLSLVGISERLDQMPHKRVVLDLSGATFIDHTFMEFMARKREQLDRRGLSLKVNLSEQHKPTSHHPLSSHSLVKGLRR